jgi:hypothetical protein
MLNAILRLGRALGAMTAIAIATLAVGLLSALPASANAPGKTVTLKGGWAPFNRCPVDNPTMLSADGESTIALCASVDSPGSIKIGSVTLLTTADSNTQFGAFVSNEGAGLAEATLVPPPGGLTAASPGQVPGGLQGLVCPSHSFLTRELCRGHHHMSSELNNVTGELVNSGSPATVDLPAGFQLETPIITLSYTLRLGNPILGWRCEIGSKSDPIVVHSENLTPPTSLVTGMFDVGGTPTEENAALTSFEIKGATQGDTSLPIPVAHGCGPGGIFDNAIDGKLALPSPAGQNSMVLSGVTSFLGGLTNPAEGSLPDGQELAKDWHAAVVPPVGHKHDGRW